MFGGTRLIASTRSPPTASARLRRSVVVVTMRSRSCARLAEASNSDNATGIAAASRGGTARLKSSLSRAGGGRAPRLRGGMLCPPYMSAHGARARSLLPQALRGDVVHAFLGVGRCADAAVAGDAGEPVGVEAREVPLLHQEVDHPHRGLLHRLVEIGVAADADIVGRGFLGRQRAGRLRLGVLG